MQGYLALVLHAHLPYVRHPEHQDSLEENWLFEAITETYVPLFLILDSLIEDDIDFRLTVSLSPTLGSMLLDPLLQSRYLKKLERTIELAEKEVERTASWPAFHSVAKMYHRLHLRVREAFVERYQKNLVGGLQRYQQTGKVEVMASAATHGYLPLLSVSESAVRAQVGVGLEHYRQTFGRDPNGFWLPECGYYPGVDRILSDHNIRYTILETHGITRADHRPHYGVYTPIICPSGVAAFGRDPDCSQQVWSSTVGYPGDFDYREFYRDIGHDLDLDYIGPYIHPDGIRIDTGIKYYRITGAGKHKEPYVPERAEHKAATHAAHFLSERIKQATTLLAGMDRKPLMVAPYDAELFGHWWFEGPRWLDYLIRQTAEQDTIRLVTPTEYLAEYPDNQSATPCLSSWGRNGFNEVWLNSENDWIYRHLQQGAELLERLGAANPRAAGVTKRAMDQAARELLLAQASDWAFMIHSGAMKEYATRRTKGHLHRLYDLGHQIEGGQVDEAALRALEGQDCIFAGISAGGAFAEGVAHSLPARAVERVPVALPPRLKIVMASPEMIPFAKTGGLADMVGSLAVALREAGHEVCAILPAYRQVLESRIALRETGQRIAVPMGGRLVEGMVLEATAGKDIPVYFIRCDRFFNRPFLYGGPEGGYADNGERFAFFSRGVLEVLRGIGAPHVLHVHDWQAALAIAFLRAQPELYPGLGSTQSMLTIHNLGYQGHSPANEWDLLGLDRSLFTPRHLEFYGKINFLKGGLVFADAITTVSPTYSQEIQTPEHGFGLDGLLRARAPQLVGVLNGADYETWNPRTDPLIAENYCPEDLFGKRTCKAALQAAFGLKPDPEVALLGVVARLAAQKGFDLIEAVLEEMLGRALQLVVLGTGDRRYEDFIRAVAKKNPEQLGVRIAFDDALAHQIEAGADMFLMPSHYEPCGLNQLYSMKYGTIPIVRATGGLKDSVTEFDPVSGSGTGFVFDAYEGSELLAALDRALGAFGCPKHWAALMRNAMNADYSWEHSAREYEKVYRNGPYH
ncbi:MAG TPA: glycogen synthase GlgA [Bryobacteraceae bacterium]|jgi:1,4-alpha-glucan branching enzyme|nr:glycogen synthase GlgA [Bryobacteraceae bacterium]